MEAFANYASSSDDEEPRAHTKHGAGSSSPTSTSLSLPVVNSAPLVTVSDPYGDIAAKQLAASSSTQLAVNLPIDSTLAAYHGPVNAYARPGQSNPALLGGGKEIVTGIVERTDVDDLSFDAQYHTYNQQHLGMALNRAPVASQLDGAIIIEAEVTTLAKPRAQPKSKPMAKSFTEVYGDEDTHGIWAPFQEKRDITDAEAGTLTQEQARIRQERIDAKKRKAEEKSNAEFDEEMDFDRMIEKKTGHLLPARLRAGQEAMEARTEFVGGQEYDYLGRSWVEPPRGLKPADDDDHQVFLPKKCIHKWTGHTKGVQVIELFPKYGHLLLSGSMDNTVRIWDVYNERKCKRIYEGHTGAVRGISMSNDGRQFLSCGFDRFIQLWDTETGQSIKSFTNRRVPYCIKFFPEDNTNFVIGDSNNMVVQFDTRSGEIVQEYNHHLQAVNSVTFVDDNRRFVSTSDDKKILIWEWGIPVPIKYISEPSMHSMPAVTLHPSGAFFAGQSLNNQIDVYTARDKFKLQRKKVFKGHSNAGYACQIGFSPNGQYVMSGDGEGKLCFWDWKSTKMYKKLRAHDRGPCMGVAWHPIEPSQVVSCGWDGLIKLWD